MQQLVQFSFFNQFYYFIFFFLYFYFLITYYFLPKICYSIKFRKKKIDFDKRNTNQILFEKNNSFLFFNNSYNEFSKQFEQFYLKKIVIYTQTQVEKTKELPIVNNIFKQKINFFLNQKFLILKKIFFIF
jgi:hypothetical protein